jgi:5-methylcytosine-specific restriction endonuclease McrA
MKQCMRCKRTLEEKSFVKTGSGNRGNICHNCKRKSRSPEYKSRRSRVGHLKKTYGISIDDYNNLLERQDGLCAICKTDRNLVIDHCHDTSMVRGLLCQQCNSGIGMLKDDPDLLRAALQYLS